MSRFLLRCVQVVHVYVIFVLRYTFPLSLFHVVFMFISSLYQVYFKFISSLFQVFSGCVSRLFSVSRFTHVFLYAYFTIFVRCFSRFNFRVDDF